jgi:hypothetical protein
VGAVAAALLFSVHSMRMESVAWIAERKDVLSGFFFLLAILTYLRYVDRRGWSALGWYAFALLSFILACMSKSIVIILPAFLFLLDWGVLDRRAWIEKAPFVLVAGLVGELGFYAVYVGVHNLLSWDEVGLGPRVLHVAYSQVYYVWRTLWPTRLSHMIEYTWAPSLSNPIYGLCVYLVLVTALALVLLRLRWLTAAVLAYAVAVMPQSGLFQNGNQFVGNRYSYLASLPLVLLAGAGVVAAFRWRPRLTGGAVALVVVVLSLETTIMLPRIWKNDEVLWTYAAIHEPTCTECQDWAGAIAYQRGDLAATARYFERAIAISDDTAFPRYERWWGYGKVLEEMGRRDDALKAFRFYLSVIPIQYRSYEWEQAHIKNAQVHIARLESR